MTHAGKGAPTVTFVGIGDVVSGALFWHGVRAYSAAKAGTKIANVCNSGDANCADINSLANGDFDVATAQGSPLNCGGGGGTCTIKTLYDQSPALSCTAGTACNVTQATIATRMTLVFNSTANGKVSFACSGTQSLWGSSLTSSFAPPYTFVAAGARTSGTATSYLYTTPSANDVGIGWRFSGGSVFFTPNSITENGYTEGNFASLIGVVNAGGTTGTQALNGTNSGSQTAGNTTNVGEIDICSDFRGSNALTGNFIEGGVWGSDLTSSIASLYGNQSSYYGGF